MFMIHLYLISTHDCPGYAVVAFSPTMDEARAVLYEKVRVHKENGTVLVQREEQYPGAIEMWTDKMETIFLSIREVDYNKWIFPSDVYA